MATIYDYYEQTQLSLAAYALNLLQGMSGSSQTATYINDLTNAGMTPQQAADFANTYTVLAQYSDALTGFSATLFENTATGQKCFAIGGTVKVLPDLLADAAIAFGNPLFDLQIPDMVNFYNQLKTEGLIAPTDSLTVTGHSSGGYLAQLLTILDPTQISETYTYNAPGFADASALAVSLLQKIDTNITGVDPASLIVNIQGGGPNVIAGLGNLVGGEQTIFTAGTSHKIESLSDSLAVYNFFSELDPTLNNVTTGITTITDILEASSYLAANSLDSTITALGILFHAPTTVISVNTGGDFYKSLDDLRTALSQYDISVGPAIQPNYNFTISDLTTLDANQIASDAQNTLGYRYALVNLNPFAVTGNDAIYTQFDASGQLDVYNPATGKGALTTQYLQDRAAMLAVQIQYNIGDSSSNLSGNIFYKDAATYNVLNTGNGNLTIDALQHIEFGADGAILNGGSLGDRLYAGTGNETIKGVSIALNLEQPCHVAHV